MDALAEQQSRVLDLFEIVENGLCIGGVLTALGQFLIASGRVKSVLHLAAQRSHPMRSAARTSFDAASVLEGAGSRYGPGSALSGLSAMLHRGEPPALPRPAPG